MYVCLWKQEEGKLWVVSARRSARNVDDEGWKGVVLTIVSGFDHCGTQILDGLEEALGLFDVLGLEDGRCPRRRRSTCFALFA